MNTYSYGVNLYSHANLIFYLNIHDVWSGFVVLNGILGDFSPFLTTVSFNRIDAMGSGVTTPPFKVYFDLQRELYVGWIRSIVSQAAFTGY